MRIVSLLPSLTELVAALGRADALVGVTHECDYPPGVERLPHLTRSRIPTAATSAEIDALVMAERGSLYELDGALLARLAPDLILTQEQCDVCAVNEQTVRRAAASLPGTPHVESVNPTDLAGVHAVTRLVGRLLDVPDRAESLISSFESASSEIARRLAGIPPRRALLLEWPDPPFSAGHWNPELLTLAGGLDVIARPGERSRRLTWPEIAASDPDIILLSPCGFPLDRTRAELASLASNPSWTSLRAVRSNHIALIDGSSYFSRPGPRLLDSLLIAAAALHPSQCLDLAPTTGWEPLAPEPPASSPKSP